MSHFYQKHVFFCVNQKVDGKKCCQNAGAKDFFEYACDTLKARDLFGPHKIRISSSGCLGRCAKGPMIVVYPDNVWYSYATSADIDEIIDSHLVGQTMVERLRIHE